MEVITTRTLINADTTRGFDVLRCNAHGQERKLDSFATKEAAWAYMRAHKGSYIRYYEKA